MRINSMHSPCNYEFENIIEYNLCILNIADEHNLLVKSIIFAMKRFFLITKMLINCVQYRVKYALQFIS